MSAIVLLPMSTIWGQQNAPKPAQPAPAATGDTRILGVIPNYQTVSNAQGEVPPLAARQKWRLFVRESVDPFTFFVAAMGAGLSQAGNSTPGYGQGGGAYAERFGAALADAASRNFFSDAALASALHEDPRYFRKGPQFSVSARLWYALSRSLITRRDSGRPVFNWSNLGGTALSIGLSDAYYPAASRNGRVMGTRMGASLSGSALGNILPEFWPDVRERLLKHHGGSPDARPASGPAQPGSKHGHEILRGLL